MAKTYHSALTKEKLLAEVEKRPILYDLQKKSHKLSGSLWVEIANEMNQTVTTDMSAKSEYN